MTTSSSAPLSAANHRFALDMQQFGDLRLQQKNDPQGAVKAVAQQFEALFIDMMMRSMREASLDDDSLFDSEHTKNFIGMLDQQFSQQMASSGRGIGLADALVRQMTRAMTPATALETGESITGVDARASAANGVSSVRDGTTPIRGNGESVTSTTATSSSAKTAAASPEAEKFVQAILPHAKVAASELGVAPQLVVAHAALESGWGKREIRTPDGRNTHNLFGIKADKSWQGASVEVSTTEYVAGIAQRRVEKFRAYASYAEAFQDYARFLGKQRYDAVRNQGDDAHAFAQGLQRGGYATDPAYAKKVSSVANGATLKRVLG